MKRWCWLLLLLCCTAWGHPLIRVGGYPYAPFVVKDDSGHYRGLTLDLIALLNDIQQDVHFVFVPTSAPHRYKALALGAPYISAVGLCRSSMAAAMSAKNA